MQSELNGDVVTEISQVTPVWLTERLRTKGFLRQGRITHLQILSAVHKNSTLYHLTLSYSADQSPPPAPARLLLKIPRPDFAWDDREVEFYQAIAPLMLDLYPADDLPIVHCYDSSYSAATRRSHLLLEDLSLTHFTTDGLMPPSRQYCQQVMDAYALFHAYWWEHPRLGQETGELLTEETIDTFLNDAQAKLAEFVNFMGERLAKGQRDILEAVVSVWPARRRKRVIRGEGVTLVHRDPHPLNFLYPREPTQGLVKLIDWQSWRVDTGTDDLAYLMACHWPFEKRVRIERDLLKRYHQRLVQLGVKNYRWDDCWYDYRASVIRCLFFLMVAWSPVQWEAGMWWQRIEQGLEAFENLECAELLQF